jgi:nitroreductase
MHTSQAIRQRRSIKRFTALPVTRDAIETILSLATLAPNHRLTQPWRFYVLGPEARHAYGLAVGKRKAKKIEQAEIARTTVAKIADEHRALPAIIAVAVVRNENPEVQEEDYGAAMMAIENMALAAVELELGTHIKTGGVMDDADARLAVGARDDERIVAVVYLGAPAELPAPKPRSPATGFTTWVP